MKKKFLPIIFAVFLVIGFSTTASAIVVFADGNGDGLADTDYYLSPGGTATFDIYVDDLSSNLYVNGLGNGLVHFALNIYFNETEAIENLSPAQVGSVSASVNDALWSEVAADINPYNAGESSPETRMAHFYLAGNALVWNTSVEPPYEGITDNKILLGTVGIECLSPGDSLLDLEVSNILGNWWSANELVGLQNVIPDAQFEYQDVTIHQSAVPIPGALWLLGSGLLGIVGLRRRVNS